MRRALAHEGEVELAVAQQRVLFEELVELAWEKARSRGEAWGQGGEGG